MSLVVLGLAVVMLCTQTFSGLKICHRVFFSHYLPNVRHLWMTANIYLHSHFQYINGDGGKLRQLLLYNTPILRLLQAN